MSWQARQVAPEIPTVLMVLYMVCDILQVNIIEVDDDLPVKKEKGAAGEGFKKPDKKVGCCPSFR